MYGGFITHTKIRAGSSNKYFIIIKSSVKFCRVNMFQWAVRHVLGPHIIQAALGLLVSWFQGIPSIRGHGPHKLQE